MCSDESEWSEEIMQKQKWVMIKPHKNGFWTVLHKNKAVIIGNICRTEGEQSRTYLMLVYRRLAVLLLVAIIFPFTTEASDD